MDVTTLESENETNGTPEGFANENSSTELDPSHQCL
jgi:hypothetical protein